MFCHRRSGARADSGGGKAGSGWILCDNPMGKDDTGGSAARKFCIGNGHIRENLSLEIQNKSSKMTDFV